MSDDTVTSLTTGALDIATAFDQDVNEAIRTAGQLMRTGLADDADHAFDIITNGLQTTTGDAGELLETLNEYAEPLRSFGLDGQQATELFNAGLEAGAFNLDKVGDALKEFSIRAIDGSKATSEAYAQLGLDGEEMARKIAAGGEEATEATSEIIQALIAMDDQVAQDAAGVALFGSTWEDLGPQVIGALDPAKVAMDDISNATEAMGETLNDNLATRLEGIKRTAMGHLADIAGAGLDAATALVDAWGEDGFSGVMDLIGPHLQAGASALWEWIQDAVPQALAALGELITAALNWLSSEGLPSLREKMGEFLPALSDWIGDAIPVVAEKLVEFGGAFIRWVADVLPPLLAELGLLLGAIVLWVGTDLLPTIALELAKLGLAFIGWVAESTPGLLLALGQLLIDLGEWFITDGIPTITEKAVELGLGLLAGIGQGLVGLATSVGDWIKAGWDAAVEWLVTNLNPFSLASKISLPDIWETIKNWVVGIWDSAWNVLKNVLTKHSLFNYIDLPDIWEKIKGWIEAAWDKAVEWVKKHLNPSISASSSPSASVAAGSPPGRSTATSLGASTRYGPSSSRTATPPGWSSPAAGSPGRPPTPPEAWSATPRGPAPRPTATA